MSKKLEDKHCWECGAYQERTSGTGYCSEWDTIVDLTDQCIEKKELQALAEFEKTKEESSKCHVKKGV